MPTFIADVKVVARHQPNGSKRVLVALVLDQLIVTESPCSMLVSLAEIVAVGSGSYGWLGNGHRSCLGHRARPVQSPQNVVRIRCGVEGVRAVVKDAEHY